MTDSATIESQHPELARAITMSGLELRIDIIDSILANINDFDTLLRAEAPQSDIRRAFPRTMMAALGGGTSLERIHRLADGSGIGLATVKRYMTGATMPHVIVLPVLVERLRVILREEQDALKSELLPLKTAQEAERAQATKEWEELQARVQNPEPTKTITFAPPEIDGNWQLHLRFTYPCKGIYHLASRFGTYVCPECDAHGHDKVGPHGRVILDSEDGSMLLPHIIRSTADLLQVLSDMRAANEAKGYFRTETPDWFAKCQRYLMNQQLVRSLPQLGKTETQYDLTKEKLAWHGV